MNDMYDRIDALLEQRGMSRRQMAIAAGVNVNSVATAFARRTKNVSLDMVRRIADVLGVSLLELIGTPEELNAASTVTPAVTAKLTKVSGLLEELQKEIRSIDYLLGRNDEGIFVQQ